MHSLRLKRPSTLALGSGIAVYTGQGFSAASHRHSAVQIVKSMGAPMQLCVAGQEFSALSAVIPADVGHSLDAQRGPLILALVEPSGSFGRAVNSFALAHIGADISEMLPGLTGLSADPELLLAQCRSALAEVVGIRPSEPDRGRRVEVTEAERLVVSHLDTVPRLTDVAASVGLSPRQLSRSFTEQVGMPFQRFIVWSRIRRAVLALRDGHDLTNAAATAGFADSAHFSRVFLGMFGLQPSKVLPLIVVAEVNTGR